MSYNAIDVARHVINYSNEKGYGISNLKLQKLLYFVQASFLGAYDKTCFEDAIEAWDFGPVVPSVYREYKQYGSSDIPTIKYYFSDAENHLSGWRISYEDNVLNKRDKEFVDYIVDGFAGYSAIDLVRVTHNQDPWRNAYKKSRNSIISIESIKEFYFGSQRQN